MILDYFLISNILQVFVKYTDILISLSSDHSPILVSLMKSVFPQKGTGIWKFKCFLLYNAKFIGKMKNHLTGSLKNADEENVRN